MQPFLLLLTGLSSLTLVSGDDLLTRLNPGCKECGPKDNLLYAKASVSNQTYHHIWSSLGQDYPTFLFVHSDSDEDVSIDWPNLLTGKPGGTVKVPGPVNDIGLVMKDVLFWNDTEKTGVLNESESTVIDWLRLDKNNVSMSSDNSSAGATFLYRGRDSNLTVAISVSASIRRSRFAELPRLLLSPTSFHIQAVVTGDPKLIYKNGRLVLDMVFFHRKGNVTVKSETAIDDEFSPGVFSISTASVEADSESFVQWKPVAYNKADRIIAHTVDTGVSFNQTSDSNRSRVASGYYDLRRDFEAASLRVAFGAAKDTFYPENEYTSFSFVVGLGAPEQDGLSFLVQLIIWIGFGIPALALLAGAAYLGVKRLRSRVASHTLLQD